MVSPSYFPIVGGTETVVQNLSMKLNEIGVLTDVMTLNMNKKWYPILKEEIREDGFKVFRIPAFNPFSKSAINPLGILLKVNIVPNLKFAKRFKDYDIIHFHDDVDLSFPAFSFFIKKPKILHYHTLDCTFNNYKKNVLSRYILKNVIDLHICHSKSTSILLLDLGIPQTQIRFLPNGVDTQKFKPKMEKKIDNLVLFVGRLQRHKGLHVLLKSLVYLRTPVHLMIAGPPSNPKYLLEMLTLIKQKTKGIHNVTYLGLIDDDNIVGWYQKASIFVCPSLLEPFGIVNLEALSCETPVVASNVGGIPEIVHDHINGILVPPNDPIKLADAIQYLLDNPEIRIRYGREGRRQVLESFSWDVIAKRLCEIYEEITNSMER